MYDNDQRLSKADAVAMDLLVSAFGLVCARVVVCCVGVRMFCLIRSVGSLLTEEVGRLPNFRAFGAYALLYRLV